MTEKEIEVELKGLKELMEFKFDALQEAIKLQAKEYERRLEFLNGEAERLREMQATYLPRELYETEYDNLYRKLEGHQTFIDNLKGKEVIIPIAISVIIGIVVSVINRLM